MGEIAIPARANGRIPHRDLSENEGRGALTSTKPGGQDRALQEAKKELEGIYGHPDTR
jgi:hypothetical protein